MHHPTIIYPLILPSTVLHHSPTHQTSIYTDFHPSMHPPSHRLLFIHHPSFIYASPSFHPPTIHPFTQNSTNSLSIHNPLIHISIFYPTLTHSSFIHIDLQPSFHSLIIHPSFPHLSIYLSTQLSIHPSSMHPFINPPLTIFCPFCTPIYTSP